MTKAPPVRDAVTAVLTVGDSVYITRRQPNLPAFPGYWAFPGGKVDHGDSEQPLGHPILDAHPARLMQALARELQEEIEFDLLAAARDGTLTAVHCLGEATTPAFAPLRFRTWFFRLFLNEQPPLQPDPGELAEAAWRSAAELKSAYSSGRLLVMPPTREVADRLTAEPAADSVPALSRPRYADDAIPVVSPLGGLRIALIRSNTIPPADRTNAFLLGDADARHILVDPSPADDEEYARVIALLTPHPPDEIFLTHHHPDHRERADDLARHFRIPIGMSADTKARITQRTQGRFFQDLDCRCYAEGDVLTRWQGEDIKVYAVPGHDEGQLALMPESRQWCIVSDLIQGVGTVVIGGPESNMRKYFASLQRVIDWDPAVVIPSHGMAMGTTFRIRATLEHRQQREQQVLALHQAGLQPAEMVPKIYQGLDPRLLPLARMNVESHLSKLREDGTLL